MGINEYFMIVNLIFFQTKFVSLMWHLGIYLFRTVHRKANCSKVTSNNSSYRHHHLSFLMEGRSVDENICPFFKLKDTTKKIDKFGIVVKPRLSVTFK